jgi:hypothetical protein
MGVTCENHTSSRGLVWDGIPVHTLVSASEVQLGMGEGDRHGWLGINWMMGIEGEWVSDEVSE